MDRLGGEGTSWAGSGSRSGPVVGTGGAAGPIGLLVLGEVGGTGVWHMAGAGGGSWSWFPGGLAWGGRRVEGVGTGFNGESRETAGRGGIARSSSTVRGGGVGYTGRIFLRNFLLRRVARLEPSVLTRYWSNWRTSTMMPVLSHFRGKLPVWFWSRTWSPTRRGEVVACVPIVVRGYAHGGCGGQLP